MTEPAMKDRYGIIRGQEEILAYAVAREVIDRPKASVWIIFIPVLFVYHAYRIQKYRKGIHAFARHFLFTKLHALDAALGEAGTTAPSAGERGGPAPLPGAGGETPPLSEEQIREIALLREHYLRLLRSPGGSCAEWVKNAYGNGGNYRIFLHRLAEAEARVNEAAIRHHRNDPDARAIAARMTRAVESLRNGWMTEFFP